MIQINAGDAYIDRLDATHQGTASVMLISGSGAAYCNSCNFTSETASVAAPGVKVVHCTSTRLSTFGLCLFAFSNTNVKTNANGFWCLRYDAPSFPGAGVGIGYCSFSPSGMAVGQSVAGSNGSSPASVAAIIYGACLAAPGGASTVAGVANFNKIASTVVV